jgi:hypothetical protein
MRQPAFTASKKLVHYSAAEDAPWLWYEPFDLGRVPARGGHGTDMFQVHPELSGKRAQEEARSHHQHHRKS